MDEYQVLAVIAAFVFAYSVVASRLDRTPINGALVYLICGLICGPSVLRLVDVEMEGEDIKLLAELTLAVLLFSDSANANLSVLRRFERLPLRLLLIGLPLTIGLGFGVGFLLFDDLSPFAIALLATMLAPTDAALGKAVVTNESVPDAVREGLNVESGLNDGICVPVLLIFLTLATQTVDGSEAVSMLFSFPLKAIGVGVLVGLPLAFLGAKAVTVCHRLKWLQGTWQQVPVIALSLCCFALAQLFGGSGFIASFVGGMLFGALCKSDKEEYLNASEGTGDTLSLITWFLFGAIFIVPQLESTTWQVIVYALLSLTVVRMFPVFLCVLGMRLHLDTKLFIGWFGPRGLASIVFIVMVATENIPGQETLMATVVWTIVFSIVLHGLSANPLARRYGTRVEARGGEI